MRIRSIAVCGLIVLALGVCAQGDNIPGLDFEIDGVRSSIAGFGIQDEIEIIEFKDGDDSITHKRAGKGKVSKYTLERPYQGESPAFDSLLNKVLKGTTDRKSGSVIYLDRAGQEVLRNSFGDFGDMELSFPPAGSFQSGESKPITIKGLAHIHKEGIVHRDIAARGMPKPTATLVLKDIARQRAVNIHGFSGITVTLETADTDGDGVPDATASVRSSQVQIHFDEKQNPYIEQWRRETLEAAAKGVPSPRQLSFYYQTRDGWALELSFGATYVGHIPNGTGDDCTVTATTETMVFRPARGEVKAG